jgi:hypothetical protein
MTVPAVFDQLNLVVKNMDAMAAFYRCLGVTLEVGRSEWAPHHRNGVSHGAAVQTERVTTVPAGSAITSRGHHVRRCGNE